jgi:hypothetical protein
MSTSPTDRSPSAVIWMSGLGTAQRAEGLEQVAKRIAFAYDRRAPDARTTYAVRTATSDPQHLAERLPVPRCTILRSDAHGTQPILDLYAVATAQVLIGDRADRSQLRQLGFALRAVAGLSSKARRTKATQQGKTPAERQQLRYARAWIVLMMLGVLALIGLLASSVVLADIPKELRIIQAPIALIAGLGIWRSAAVKRIASSALVGYSVVDYLDRGEDRGSELRGRLTQLLEQLAQRELPYEHIDVVAYSFGSIAAIDALFPYVQPPPPRLATIDRLVTIACPFDFVRSYWPDYFTKRFAHPGRPAEWVNFYAPSDVLASNFQNSTSGIVEPTAEAGPEAAISGRDSPLVAPPPLNVAYLIDGRDEPVAGWESMRLKGLRFHGQYWSSRVASEESVFDQVIDHLGPLPQPRAPAGGGGARGD